MVVSLFKILPTLSRLLVTIHDVRDIVTMVGMQVLRLFRVTFSAPSEGERN